MASKHSKKTLELLAQHPAFDSWIINNLTPEQLDAVRLSEFDQVWFGDAHPLNSEELGVLLWRAYRKAVVFELKYRWGDNANYDSPPAGCEPAAYFHQSVCNAISLFVNEQPELMDKTVERHRREIEEASGPGRTPNVLQTSASPGRL